MTERMTAEREAEIARLREELERARKALHDMSVKLERASGERDEAQRTGRKLQSMGTAAELTLRGLSAECDSLRERVRELDNRGMSVLARAERAEAALRDCIDALATVPEDQLGYATSDNARWPILRELLDKARRALDGERGGTGRAG